MTACLLDSMLCSSGIFKLFVGISVSRREPGQQTVPGRITVEHIAVHIWDILAAMTPVILTFTKEKAGYHCLHDPFS